MYVPLATHHHRPPPYTLVVLTASKKPNKSCVRHDHYIHDQLWGEWSKEDKREIFKEYKRKAVSSFLFALTPPFRLECEPFHNQLAGNQRCCLLYYVFWCFRLLLRPNVSKAKEEAGLKVEGRGRGGKIIMSDCSPHPRISHRSRLCPMQCVLLPEQARTLCGAEPPVNVVGASAVSTWRMGSGRFSHTMHG
eukprot:g3388.t1